MRNSEVFARHRRELIVFPATHLNSSTSIEIRPQVRLATESYLKISLAKFHPAHENISKRSEGPVIGWLVLVNQRMKEQRK
jgi:hypothetical protein